MTLHIKDPKADRLARELAKVTGETLTDAVTRAIEERLGRQKKKDDAEARLARVMAILAEVDKLPVYDDRSADEIIGYNEHGLFD
jgi:antitoxin VapB